MNIQEILTYNFAGNLLKEYLISLGVFLLTIVVLKVFKKVAMVKIKQFVDHTKTDFDDLLVDIFDSIGWPFYIFLSLYLSLRFIHLSKVVNKIFFFVVVVLTAYYTLKIVQKLIDYTFDKAAEKRRNEEEGFDPSVLDLLNKTIKWILWVGAVIIVLQSLGYNISALVAGLGIGGVAIAFALQNILGDIFASFSIYLDRPFQTGDFIIIGNDSGIVKKIGIKSTRIQTLQGEELVISNKELTETRVHNYKKMKKRRVVFSFDITYGTPNQKVKKIPKIVKDILDNIELAELNRVHFKSFGNSGLVFEIVYLLNSSDHTKYMDVQQEINLAIKERFEKEGISFAYPTQTIFLKKT